MDNQKAKDNSILRQETTMQVSLDLIKNKEEEHIIGQESNQMYTKDSLKVEKEMEGVHFGGLMEVGIKVISKTACNVAMEPYIEKVAINNMKGCGKTECSMAKVFNSSITDKDMKAISNKTNFMEMVSFTKTIQ